MQKVLTFSLYIIIFYMLATTVGAQTTSWQQAYPLPTGNSLFDVTHVTANKVIAVGGGGVMLLSTNGGENWKQIYRPGGVQETFHGVAFKDTSIGVVVGEQGTIILTTDGGMNWVLSASGTIKNLYGISYVSSDTFCAVGESGTILLSADNGITWFPRTSGTTVDLHAVDFAEWTRGFAVGDTCSGGESGCGGVVSTSDGGTNWTVYGGSFARQRDVKFFNKQKGWVVGGLGKVSNGAINFPYTFDTSEVYFGKSASQLPKNWYSIVPLSADSFIIGGEYHLWKLKEIAGNTLLEDIELFGDSGKELITYGLSTDGGGNVIAVGLGGMIFKSTNSGDEWTEIGDAKIGLYNGIYFSDSANGWLTGGNRGIYKTSNAGRSWQLPSGYGSVPHLPNSNPYVGNYHGYGAIQFLTNDSGYILGDQTKIIRTTNGGTNWANVYIPADGTTEMHFFDMDTGIVAGAGGAGGWPDVRPSIYRTTNKGATWAEMENMLGSTKGILYDVFFLNDTTGWACGAIGAWPSFTPIVFKSTDRGVNWSTAPITTDITNGGFMAISFLDVNTGYAVGFQGEFLNVTPIIMKTTNGGSNWTTVNHPYANEVGIFQDITFADGNIAFVVGGSGFQKYQTDFFIGNEQGTGFMLATSDGGSTWNSQSVPSSFLRHVTVTAKPGVGYIAFATGAGVVCAATVPLNNKVWAGTIDTDWNNPNNWSPSGVPLKFHDVVIPDVTNDPVTNNNIIVGSLTIQSGSTLTINPPATQVIVKGGYYQYGNVVDNVDDKVNMVVGGDFIVQPGGPAASSSVNHAKKTLASLVEYKPKALLNGVGEARGSFDDMVVDANSSVSSSGNISIDNRFVVLNDFNLQEEDTVEVFNSQPNALVGGAIIPTGTIKRAIENNSTEAYRFESEKSYVQFGGTGTYPEVVSMRARPSTTPRSFSLYWEAVLCSLNTTENTVKAKNVHHFSRWAFGTVKPNSSFYEPRVERTYEISATSGGEIMSDVAPATLELRYNEDELETSAVEDSLVLLRGPIVIGKVQPRWNMVSLPVIPEVSHKDSVFPTATSNLWSFNGTYQSTTNLQFGKGYWAKFVDSQQIPILGEDKEQFDLPVVAGWNLIGSISYDVFTDQITSTPLGIIASPFYGYNGSYVAQTTLKPMKGYWVKTSSAGTLHMISSTQMPKQDVMAEAMSGLNKMEIRDADGNEQVLYFGTSAEKKLRDMEMPPRPPAGIFDARYGTNRLVELSDVKETKERAVVINYAKYPLTLRWELTGKAGMAKLHIGSQIMELTKNGSVEVSDANNDIRMELLSTPDVAIPKEYTLSQNYPNPFNPVTVIKYELPEESKVTLTIYNILGQKVAMLRGEIEDAGYKTLEWNANTLASGVYMYRLDAQGLKTQGRTFTEVKKLLLMK